MAKNLGLKVLAEYVETESQREALHEIGCDLYQGYLYSPAVFLTDSVEGYAGEKENQESER